MVQAKPIEVTDELRHRLIANTARGDGCHEWLGSRSTKGYGCLWVGGTKGRRIYAHRAAYTVFVGPVPGNLTLDHLCRNRLCVNPAHLEPVTDRENVLRGMSPMAIAIREGQCKRGHPREPANMYSRGQCRKCAVEGERERRKAREAADPSRREARLARMRQYHRERRCDET